MKIAAQLKRRLGGDCGMTLVEVMLAGAISSIVLAILALLIVFTVKSFVALANYQELDAASSFAADNMSREIRQATAVGSVQGQGNTRWIVFTNANTSPAYTFRYDWNSTSRELTRLRSTENGPATVLLKGCDQWNFKFYQRTPMAGPNFGFSTNIANTGEYKLVEMTWKCSRSVNSTALINTESVQTAQIVLRNQKTP